MRHSASSFSPDSSTNKDVHVKQTLATLLPYIWAYRWRVMAAMGCLILAKLLNVAVPMVFKEIIDHFSATHALVAAPVGLIALYGFFRFSTSLFTELREILFAKVTQQASRRIALQSFNHLHALSMRFHLERQTGGITRDIERGTRAISSLISYSLYSILPTLVEITLVLGILFAKYDTGYVLITLGSLIVYLFFTVKLSNWRIGIRRAVNEADSKANTCAVDSLINYETVKYFNNEAFEAKRYDAHLVKLEDASIKSQTTLAGLNLGQQFIIAIGVTLLLWRAASGVESGTMSIGDLVLVNAFLIQLYIPLNFLGIVYREIRQAFADIEKMFNLLNEPKEITDRIEVKPLPSPLGDIQFNNVHFSYNKDREILKGLNFTIPQGKTTAIVGHSGSGKSTIGRLLYRFYDVTEGSITLNQIDLRDLPQAELRQSIGIVPQDTVLFNDSIYFNIHYGEPGSTETEVHAAASRAQIHPFISSLKEGYLTKVGERGLKLSGGEKQRVAIARCLLKDPDILIFDEATSALDTATEKEIQTQIKEITKGKTTILIAHRLSTIKDADQIVVMEQGEIVEIGSHEKLLNKNGYYTHLWNNQSLTEHEKDL